MKGGYCLAPGLTREFSHDMMPPFGLEWSHLHRVPLSESIDETIENIWVLIGCPSELLVGEYLCVTRPVPSKLRGDKGINKIRIEGCFLIAFFTSLFYKRQINLSNQDLL